MKVDEYDVDVYTGLIDFLRTDRKYQVAFMKRHLEFMEWDIDCLINNTKPERLEVLLGRLKEIIDDELDEIIDILVDTNPKNVEIIGREMQDGNYIVHIIKYNIIGTMKDLIDELDKGMKNE